MRDRQPSQLLASFHDGASKSRRVLGGHAEDLDDIGFADGGPEQHRVLHAIEKIEPIIIAGCNRTARLQCKCLTRRCVAFAESVT